MRKVISIIFLFLFLSSYGQKLSYIQVDTLTYNQYLRQEWKELIASGKNALENDIDYYYLQMRIAYAYFSLEKYRDAISYYKNALSFNSYDPVANEYLYYSYLFSGRENDALLQRDNLSAVQKKAMEIKDSRNFHALSLSYSHLFSNAASISESIPADMTMFVDGVQKATYTLGAPRVDIYHRAGNHVLVHHTISNSSKNELSYVINGGTEYYSGQQDVSQFEYGLGLDIALTEGLVLSPGFHYTNTSIPLFDESSYGIGSGRDRFILANMRISGFAPYIKLQLSSHYFDAGISYLHNNYNQIQGNQAGLHLKIYPLANLNLYLNLDAYYQYLDDDFSSAQNFITKPLLGFKVFKNLWLEGGASLTGEFNYFDLQDYVAYNSLERSRRNFQVNAIIPWYKKGVKIFITYKNSLQESSFYPVSGILDSYNLHEYQSHVITGGIKWTK